MMKTEIVFEEIRLEYIPEVIRINEVVLPENYPYYFYELLYRNYPKAFFVAKVDNKIVGYIMCRVEHSFRVSGIIPKFSKVGHVVSIGVLPDYRRLGIGSELMNRAMETLKNIYKCSEVYLEVRVSNEAAINFYDRLGFKIDRVIKHYYKDGEDAYVMSKGLE
jgi:ribosomal-protein-alanine N-acetyltransferase